MADLPKPDHLSDPPSSLAKRPAGVATLALGALVFLVTLVSQQALWATPDWRITVPGFAVTALAALVSIAMREKASVLWLSGLGLAAAALVLGWFLMFAIVIGATVVLILILHTVM